MAPRFFDGQRLILWVWDVRNRKPLFETDPAKQFVGDLCTEMDLTPISAPEVWKTPPGLVCFLPVLESHIILHTWPEDDAAVLDVFSCRTFDRSVVVAWVTDYLEAGLSEIEESGGPNGFFPCPYG